MTVDKLQHYFSPGKLYKSTAHMGYDSSVESREIKRLEIVMFVEYNETHGEYIFLQQSNGRLYRAGYAQALHFRKVRKR